MDADQQETFGFYVSPQEYRVEHIYPPPGPDGLTDLKGIRNVRHELDPPNWHVGLPHQCDSWEITSGTYGMPQAEAVAELERFIAEAQQALSALREGREFGDPCL